MAHYKLEETERQDHPTYNLFCDDVILVKDKRSSEIHEFLYKVIKPGDTYQEFHGSRFNFPVLSYDDLMVSKQSFEDWI